MIRFKHAQVISVSFNIFQFHDQLYAAKEAFSSSPSQLSPRCSSHSQYSGNLHGALAAVSFALESCGSLHGSPRGKAWESHGKAIGKPWKAYGKPIPVLVVTLSAEDVVTSFTVFWYLGLSLVTFNNELHTWTLPALLLTWLGCGLLGSIVVSFLASLG